MVAIQGMIRTSHRLSNRIIYRSLSSSVATHDKIILSGIQPTGIPHLGNYVGAIRKWVKLQDDASVTNLYSVVNLHALTTLQDAKLLRENTFNMAASLIACGIDPSKSFIFQQSSVPQHCELMWIFSCLTPVGWLDRMTQFKQKSENTTSVDLGLYVYPVLMAADILIYRASSIPVGNDQYQHLELARDIASSFNKRYKVKFFPLPIPTPDFGDKNAARIMSLRDGSKKMSKSDSNEMTRIELNDSAEEISNKIKKSKTDSIAVISAEGLSSRLEITNLLTIYAAVTSIDLDAAVKEFEGYQTSKFKAALADALINHVVPIGKEITRLQDDKGHLQSILDLGNERATEIASENLMQVKRIVGLL